MVTGITPTQWAEEGEQAIVTAIALLNQATRRDDDGPQMSG